MKRDMTLYLNDILDSIEIIEGYTKGIKKDKFNESLQLQDSVIRRLEIIGEAAKHVPESFRKKYPDIQWRKVAGLRDVLTHAYFEVNIERVWKITRKDLPVLKKQIKKILKKTKK